VAAFQEPAARLLEPDDFVALFVISLFGEVLANDKPLIVRYDGHYYFPIVKDYSEKVFGGDFPARDELPRPVYSDRLESKGNFAIYPPNHFPLRHDRLLRDARPIPRRRRPPTGSARTSSAATCFRGCCTVSGSLC
jgi:ABC-type microcin C transport system permease subunit YejE